MHRVISAKTDLETERAFSAARRHSRLVRLLRAGIPVTVAGALGFTVFVAYFNPLRMLPNLPSLDKVVISGSEVTMEKPRVTGYTNDGRAYDMSATAARQDLSKPDVVELQSLDAKLQMDDKSTLQLVADNGSYNAKSEVLELENNIVLSSKSYEGRLSQATVEVRKGHVMSEKPVQLRMMQGRLEANRLEITDSGDLVRFTGGVSMTFKMPPAEDRQELEAK